MLAQPRETGGGVSDDGDIGVVAFVAAAPVGDRGKRNLRHGIVTRNTPVTVLELTQAACRGFVMTETELRGHARAIWDAAVAAANPESLVRDAVGHEFADANR